MHRVVCVTSQSTSRHKRPWLKWSREKPSLDQAARYLAQDIICSTTVCGRSFDVPLRINRITSAMTS